MSYLYFATDYDKRFVALSQLFFVIGMLFGNLSASAIADNKDKKKIILFCELARIPILILMLLFSNSIWPLLFLHGFKTFFAGISTPTKRSYINGALSTEEIPQGNMGFTIVYSITQVLGPFIGTWIYFYTKSLDILIWIDLITFVIASIMYSFLLPVEVKNEMKNKYVQEIKNGFSYISSQGSFKTLFSKHILVGLVSGFLIPLILPFCIEVLKSTEKTYGILMAVFGIGGIIGAIISSKINNRFGIGRTIYSVCLIEPVIFLLWLYTTNIYLNVFFFAIWGLIFFLRVTSQFNFISTHMHKDYNARVHSLFDFVFTSTNITAVTIITLGGKSFDTQSFLITVALGYFLINLLTHFLNSHRDFRNL